jgi:polyphosphate kinase 2 (PPK2 family)
LSPQIVRDLTEKHIVDTGVQLIKFWLKVGDEEQQRRFEARIEDPLRQWKLSANAYHLLRGYRTRTVVYRVLRR